MMQIKLQFDYRKLDAALEQLPVKVQLAALESGVRPAAKVLQQRVKELTPRSRTSGSSRLWSKKTKAARSGEPELRATVATKVLKPKNNIASALVGFRWPTGNKAHFVLPMKKSTRKVVLWGRVTGREVAKHNDWLRQAFDETRQKQISAFENGVTAAVQKKLRELNGG